MNIDFRKFKKLWLSELLSDFEMQAFLSFGTSVKSKLSPLPRMKLEIEEIDSFRTKLRKFWLANRLNAGQTVEILPTLRTKSSHPLRRYMVETYVNVCKEQTRRQREHDFVLKNNDWTSKNGPEGRPSHFCKMVLIGIFVGNRDREFIEKFSNMIRSGGSLDRLSRKRRVKKEAREILFKLHDEEISEWRKKEKQSMVRRLLSDRVNKDVKSFKLFPNEYKEVTSEVNKMAESFLAKYKTFIDSVSK